MGCQGINWRYETGVMACAFLCGGSILHLEFKVFLVDRMRHETISYATGNVERRAVTGPSQVVQPSPIHVLSISAFAYYVCGQT
jgi:hypothetical protein